MTQYPNPKYKLKKKKCANMFTKIHSLECSQEHYAKTGKTQMFINRRTNK